MTRLDRAEPSSCGPKAARLAALRRAGLPVPNGFVVPSGPRDDDAPGVDALARELALLGNVPVAVRSSAASEDAAGGSAAGQYVSVLGVQGPAAVAEAIRMCRDSWFAPRALAYRRESGHSDGPRMAVLVQLLIDADVAGVMFTGPEETEIEASWGLGPSVAEGAVTPDAFYLRADSSIGRHLGRKSSRLDRQGTALVRSIVPAHDQEAACLEDAAIMELAALGQRVATLLGAPQDIEWALAGGHFWILQARPVTAELPARGTNHRHDAGSAASPLTGIPGSVGMATGPARIVHGPTDFTAVHAGDILVCPFTDPAWTPLLGVAAGVVTERGGALSHAAIVARERRIPAVLGVHEATAQLQTGSIVTIDGTAGTVVVHTHR